VIAITDHIEYLPHKDYISTDRNKSYDLAKSYAKEKGIVLIKATEITRGMPPGHLNALFIKDANKIVVDDAYDAIKEADKQGAFIIWNHPGWKAQAPDSAIWYEEHTKLYNQGMIDGIEIFNYDEFYPSVMRWAIEKNITMFGNTDIHAPIDAKYNLKESHRPMTLVFAKTRSKKDIREAFENRRTAVYIENKIYGKAEFLQQIFKNSVDAQIDYLFGENGKKKSVVNIYNKSDLDYVVRFNDKSIATKLLKSHAHTVIKLNKEIQHGDVLKLIIENLFEEPSKNLDTQIVF
jgi:hypothetical protein